MGAVQPTTITHAALCGALLCALVAFMQGGAILAGFGVMLGQVGFFENEGIAIAYAGRSLLGLLLIVLAAAAMGALAWSIGAVLWNRIVTKYPTRGESAD